MSSFGNTASVFGTWSSLTRANRLTGKDQIVNDAMLNNYSLADALIGDADVIRGGKFIEDRVRLTNVGNYDHITPGQERTASRQRTVFDITMPWRFSENNIPWTDAEIELNSGDDLVQFKRFDKALDTDLHSEHWNGLEADTWALPDLGNMETGSAGSGAVTPGLPYSIPTFIVEGTGTSSGQVGTVPPANNGTFTTIEGLTVSTYTNWRNQVSVYNAAAPEDSTAGIFAAFDDMWSRVDFKTPSSYSRYMENDRLRKLKIFTNRDGKVKYQQYCRAANDTFRAGPEDPAYGHPVYNNIPIVHVNQLDTSLLEQNPIGTYTSAVYPAGRPRYFFVNLAYLFPVYHRARYMKIIDKDGGVRQPDTTVRFINSWWNIVCRSRRRQGIIRPQA